MDERTCEVVVNHPAQRLTGGVAEAAHFAIDPPTTYLQQHIRSFACDCPTTTRTPPACPGIQSVSTAATSIGNDVVNDNKRQQTKARHQFTTHCIVRNAAATTWPPRKSFAKHPPTNDNTEGPSDELSKDKTRQREQSTPRTKTTKGQRREGGRNERTKAKERTNERRLKNERSLPLRLHSNKGRKERTNEGTLKLLNELSNERTNERTIERTIQRNFRTNERTMLSLRNANERTNERTNDAFFAQCKRSFQTNERMIAVENVHRCVHFTSPPPRTVY